jgi:galactitol-specific phosphotransferase system IIC component
MQTLIYILLFILIAVLAATFGRSIGRSVKGGIAFASVLLGVGVVMDPPARHSIEAVESERDDSEASKDGE